jgi:hypothetical protein
MAKLKAREGHQAEVRREGVERLAAAVRALGDAVAVTGVDRATLDEVTGALELMTHRLRTATDDDAYSGLVIKPVDYSIPEGPMPLNLIPAPAARCDLDAQLRFRDGEIAGTAPFTRRSWGRPAGARRDQRDARRPDRRRCAPGRSAAAITKSLEPQYFRPLPLDEEIELWGVCADSATTCSGSVHAHRPGQARNRGQRRAVSFESFWRARLVEGMTVAAGATVSGVSKPVGR